MPAEVEAHSSGPTAIIDGLRSLPFKVAYVVAGSAVFVGLLWLGFADDYSVRIIVALGAAWIATGIPGFLQIQSRRVQAGGAIAVFVFVMIADDLGRWIGGRTVAPGTRASVPLSKKQMLFQSEIASAQFEYTQKNYRTTAEILTNARRTNPDDPLLLHMLGSAYFQMGQFSNAAETFELGRRLGGREAGRFAYNAALSYDAMHQIQKARDVIEDARRDQSSTKADYPALWAETLILRGLLYISESTETGKPLTRAAFEGAVDSFYAFLDVSGALPVWAHYNLACLHAAPTAYAPVQQFKAIDYFRKFVSGLASILDREQRKGSVELAERILLEKRSPDQVRGPGESWECPAIKTVWTSAAGDWKAVERAILSPGLALTPVEKKAPGQTPFQGTPASVHDD